MFRINGLSWNHCATGDQTLMHFRGTPYKFFFEDCMSRLSSTSAWFFVGAVSGGALLQLFFALLFAGTGLAFYYGQATLIALVDFALSFCAAYFSDKGLPFIIGYTAPLLLLSTCDTISLLYIRSMRLNISSVLLWWAFTAVILLIGCAGSYTARSIHRLREK